MAKLNPEKVLEARRRREKGEKLSSIAHDLHVSEAAISRACSGKLWKHVKPAANPQEPSL